MIKYKANSSSWRGEWIESVDVERETDQSVWVNGRRSAKETRYECYFDTWEAAHNHLVVNAISSMESAERRLDSAKDHLAEIQALTPAAR